MRFQEQHGYQKLSKFNPLFDFFIGIGNWPLQNLEAESQRILENMGTK